MPIRKILFLPRFRSGLLLALLSLLLLHPLLGDAPLALLSNAISLLLVFCLEDEAGAGWPLAIQVHWDELGRRLQLFRSQLGWGTELLTAAAFRLLGPPLILLLLALPSLFRRPQGEDNA